MRERKRKAGGKHIAYSESAGLAITTGSGETDDSNKRRKLLQDVIALDKDDDSSDEDAVPRGSETTGKSRGEDDSG